MAQLPQIVHAAVKSAEQLLGREYAKEWTLVTLAPHLGVCPVQLAEAFRAHTGLDIPGYIRKLRNARAAELLKPGIRIAEVAFAVGYNSSHSFVDAFEKEMGMLPSEYRDRGNSGSDDAGTAA